MRATVIAGLAALAASVSPSAMAAPLARPAIAGAPILTAAADGDLAAALVGPTWKLASMGTAPVIVEGQKEPPHLVFEADGAVFGSGGCNRLRGTYKLEPGGAIGFGPVASTMMACPDEAMRREDELNGVLGVAERVEIEGDRMRLFVSDVPVAVFRAE